MALVWQVAECGAARVFSLEPDAAPAPGAGADLVVQVNAGLQRDCPDWLGTN